MLGLDDLGLVVSISRKKGRHEPFEQFGIHSVGHSLRSLLEFEVFLRDQSDERTTSSVESSSNSLSSMRFSPAKAVSLFWHPGESFGGFFFGSSVVVQVGLYRREYQQVLPHLVRVDSFDQVQQVVRRV